MEYNQIFVGPSIDTIREDIEDWKKQYDDYVDFELDGYCFHLVQNRTIHKLVLYVERIPFYKADGRLYYMEVSALESFKSIDEAQAKVNGIIEYYVRGKEFLDDYSR